MTSIQILVGVIFAAVFLAIFVGLYTTYLKGSEETKFREKAEELAEIITLLGGKASGTQHPFTLKVPDNCKLWFQDNRVMIAIEESTENFNTGVNLSGEELGPGQVTLLIKRVEGGVEVHVG
jgi:hypothetical protein